MAPQLNHTLSAKPAATIISMMLLKKYHPGTCFRGAPSFSSLCTIKVQHCLDKAYVFM